MGEYILIGRIATDHELMIFNNHDRQKAWDLIFIGTKKV